MKDAYTGKLGASIFAKSCSRTKVPAPVSPFLSFFLFFDHVFTDLIVNYNISNEDLWIQGDNALSQYKNKHSFGLPQSLADNFNLQIIDTYGAARHGKGGTDACLVLVSRIF